VLNLYTSYIKQTFLGVLTKGYFPPNPLLPNVLICTYFNHSIFNYDFFLQPISVFFIFYFLSFNKLGVGKEIKIAPLDMDHLCHEMEHVIMKILMSFNDSFCYK